MLSIFLLTICSLAFSTPSSQKIHQSIQIFNSYGKFKFPTLREIEVKNLQSGKVIREISDTKDKKYKKAVAYMLTSASLEALWLASYDDHFNLDARALSFLFKDNGQGDQYWYTYAKLPWPLKDRHWVNHTSHNINLAKQTNDQIWETHWSVESTFIKSIDNNVQKGLYQRVSKAQFDEAILIPYGTGCFVGARLESETLFMFQSTVDVGGYIPQSIYTQKVYSDLEKMMRRLEKRALTIIPKHYTSPHKTMYGANGMIIPLYE